MGIEIQFLQDIKESTIPFVRVTKSITGKTGTATFLFIRPEIFDKIISQNRPITAMYLVYDKRIISTNDIQIFFKEGKPFILKAIFVFKTTNELFNFLNFINAYSKETGLLFT